MATLDRLDWAVSVPLTAHGARIGIRATRPEPLATLVDALPPVWRPSPSPVVDRMYSLVAAPPVRQRGLRHYNVLYADSARIARTEALEEVCASLVTRAHLDLALTSRLLFVHAGVVLWKSRALLLPAPSRAGKSTLVAALVRAGATYFSDEYAILDPAGRVRQYAAAISLRPDVVPDFAESLAACEPPARPRRSAPVAAIAFLRHRPDAPLRLRRVSAGEAVIGLLTNTVAAQQRPRQALHVNGRVAAASCLRLQGVRGHAAAAAERLLEELDRLP